MIYSRTVGGHLTTDVTSVSIVSFLSSRSIFFQVEARNPNVAIGHWCLFIRIKLFKHGKMIGFGNKCYVAAACFFPNYQIKKCVPLF